MKNSVKLFSSAFLLFAAVSFSTKAQTNVSGFINANTTWNLAGSPYIVTGNALLSHGYTLTIDPGVIIKFDTNRTLQIDGELIAIGTPQSRITFTSLQSIPKAGDWGKVQFRDTSIDASFDVNGKYLSGSIMKYCDVLWGGGIGFGAIQMTNATPYFTHCNILNSSSAGIYGIGDYTIDSSAIKYCMDIGLYILSSCSVTIQSDTIEGNLKGGISLSQYGCPNQKTIIQDNYFLSNSGGPTIYLWAPGICFNTTISRNLFLTNSGGMGVITCDALGGFLIQCNKFISNTNTYCIRMNGCWGGVIKSNLFQNNKQTIEGGGLADLLLLSDNEFNNNGILSQPMCRFVIPWTSANYNLNILRNSFKNNIGDGIISLIQNLGKTSDTAAVIKFNNFTDSSSQLEIKNGVPFGYTNIYADSNYWGSINTQHVDSVIYDYFDYGNLSVVYYLPILTAPVDIDTSCSFLFSSVPTISNVNYSNPFPNPFSTSTTITFKEQLKDASLAMYNVFGQKVKAMEHINADRIRVDREDLASGIYIYEVVEKQRRVANGKLVIE